MNATPNRRTAITALGAGLAGIAALGVVPARQASAAHSSAAGIVAGGSLGGDIQFSAFGTRMTFHDVPDPEFLGALAWFDPAGDDGGPLTIALASVTSYGPGELENERILAGTASVNGEGEHPFALRFLDNGSIGAAADTVRLVVGAAAAEVTGTPVPADTDFAYDVEADLVTGNIEIVTFD